MGILNSVLPSSEARAMDIETPWEREYWAKHFHVTEHELARIVKTVGADTDAVSHFIREKSKSA
jgi:Protein of unknown function (DUF3606)